MKNKMRKFADKYFLRANEILQKDGKNPWVNMQVFVRKGPGKVAGVQEAVDIIANNSNIAEVGGRIYAKKDGQTYTPKETLMNVIAPVQEIMELETVYLGVIAAAITRENDGRDIDLAAIQRNVMQVVELAGDRPVLYFGARHWHYEMDQAITKAAFDGGVKDCSTDNGAETVGKKGMGTIPHALENVYAFYSGMDKAVLEATKAFDRHMDPAIPRIALIDYNNREITDTIATARALEGRLFGGRTDTCGENVAEGGVAKSYEKYWTGTGVTVEGVRALREALNRNGLREVKVVVSSGFSNPDKVRAFNEGEKLYGLRLYDAIGAGFLDGVRTSTADIVIVGDNANAVDPYLPNQRIPQERIIHKVGRPCRANPGLERVL
jgi:nicotinate phosphoribosyltransferase